MEVRVNGCLYVKWIGDTVAIPTFSSPRYVTIRAVAHACPCIYSPGSHCSEVPRAPDGLHDLGLGIYTQVKWVRYLQARNARPRDELRFSASIPARH